VIVPSNEAHVHELKFILNYIKQEQQRVAVVPGNSHIISILQVSSDAATLRRGRCGHAAQWRKRPRIYAAAAARPTTTAAAAASAVYRQFDD